MINRSIECRRHVELEATLRLVLEEMKAGSYACAVDRLEEALAQPAVTESHKQSTTCGEPVAWDGDCVLGHCGSPAGCEASNCCRADSTTPPTQQSCSQRTWVNATTWRGLTDEEVIDLWPDLIMHKHTYQFWQNLEAKLKGKNTSNGGCV